MYFAETQLPRFVVNLLHNFLNNKSATSDRAEGNRRQQVVRICCTDINNSTTRPQNLDRSTTSPQHRQFYNTTMTFRQVHNKSTSSCTTNRQIEVTEFQLCATRARVRLACPECIPSSLVLRASRPLCLCGAVRIVLRRLHMTSS